MINSFSDYDTSSVYSDESGLELSTATQLQQQTSPLSTGIITTSTTASATVLTPPITQITTPTTTILRPASQSSSERTDSYRFSMANLEETHEAELDAILGELSLLEQRNNGVDLRKTNNLRTNSIISSNSSNYCLTNSIISMTSSTESGNISGECSNSNNNINLNLNLNNSSNNNNNHHHNNNNQDIIIRGGGDIRTDSPDNDSAFSDTVSLLSSESSASSGVGVSTAHLKNLPNLSQCDSAKAAKIHLALQKLEQASVRRLFVKAFTSDGASKSLLVDERMTCGHVTRLLSDKNHIQMEPQWSLVEHLTDLHMERLYEDHELLVDSLMLWSRDSKNRVMFLQRPDKIALFNKPERFLSGTQMAPGSEHDEHTRSMLLDEFFTSSSSGGQIAMEGPLYLKTDSRKGWKRYHFVLRASGLYYFPKEKTKSTRDLICLNSFVGYEVYKGIGWKKKHKSPTDFTFALRSPSPTTNSKTARLIKMMCAEDAETLEKWITNIRIAKYGKCIFDNHRILLDDLARDEIDKLSSARSGSIVSIISSVPSQLSTGSNNTISSNNSLLQQQQNGRLSRTSSSSSSGCLSDDNNGFDCEFPTGTIKRKPSMKPNLPLTSMTRQLKEVGETTVGSDGIIILSPTSSLERGGTLTRRHSRRRSEESNNSGTLKRRQPSTLVTTPSTNNRGSIESMNSTSSPSLTLTPTPSTPGTPSTNNTNRILFTNNNINNNCNKQQTPPQTPPSNYLSPMEIMPSCMTDSVFSLPPPPEDIGTSLSASMMSLDSLPPPPLPCELLNDFNGSQMSLTSLPLPPPPPLAQQQLTSPLNSPTKIDNKSIYNNVVINSGAGVNIDKNSMMNQSQPIYINNIEQQQQPIIYSKTSLKTSSLKSPPYKLPPQYNGSNNGLLNGSATLPHTQTHQQTTSSKSVSFADSPVLLRRKVCFDDQIQVATISRNSSRDSISTSTSSASSVAPTPPPRAQATRLSISPKRLSESISNPPRDFLKDLQRVMRKKWQVAQKCKLEPATTPHEVLGFRDFNELAQSSNYYAESANVSNWVQEHYGTSNCLYENLGSGVVTDRMSILQQQPSSIKKRPPPPPPKRSESTQLTHRSQ